MLKFIKKHYEKFILTALLVAFVVLLVIQLKILLDSKRIDPDELKLNLHADYKRVNFNDPKFIEISSLVDATKWQPGEPRVPGATLFTDFVTPLSLAKCPYCEHLIPLADFKAKKCHLCGATLKPPPEISKPRIDSDKDGISDEDEAKNGLNPNDAKDAEEDLDNDGFTNFEEIVRYNTNPRDPKSHPSYTEKLFVVDVVRSKLGLKVKRINATGDKSTWFVQFGVVREGKDRDEFKKVGATFRGDDGEFTLVDIVPEYKSEFDASIKDNVMRNYSKAHVKKKGSSEILLGEIGKDIVESKDKIVLLYAITNKKFDLYLGEEIALGDERTGVEKLVVLSCDPANQTVSVKNTGNGKTYELQQRRQRVETEPAAQIPGGLPPQGAGPGKNLPF